MHILDLNHVALHVRDVAASSRFYRDVLALPQLGRPDFDFPGAWFALGPVQQLHLIGDRQHPVHANPRGNHFALRVASIQDTAADLRQKKVDFMGPKQRPDGMWQIFIQDPDGHYIELTELPG
jgi:catechol 2,3-dioxygenase-like lactoylglutathione lyase family enzyme